MRFAECGHSKKSSWMPLSSIVCSTWTPTPCCTMSATLAVDEDDPVGYPFHVVEGVGRDAAGGDEDSPVSLLAVECTDEGLDLLATDGLLCVPLGLDVHAVEPERVLPDQAIDATVARTATVLEVAALSAVSHGGEQLEYEMLEELRRLRHNPPQQHLLQSSRCLGDGIFDALERGRFRGRLRFSAICGRSTSRLCGLSIPRPELQVLRVPPKVVERDGVWCVGQQIAATLRQLDRPSAWPVHQASLEEVQIGPFPARIG